MRTTITASIDIQHLMYGQKNVIEAATPVSSARLRIAYSTGDVYELDLQPLIAKGGALARLGEPAVFAGVQLAPDGRSIEFPGGIDFCADSLRVDCELQKAGIADPWSLDI